MKVLIAEDDPISRRMLERALVSSRYEICFAENGTTALQILQASDRPAIALLDWVLPGLDGPEVCRQLRSTVSGTRPYVIIVSAKSDKCEIAAGLDAGADDFISKPIWAEELLARMRVAERTVTYQLELQQQIEKFESLARRYSLLGEIVAQQLQRPADTDDLDAMAELEVELPRVTPTRPASVWFAPGEIEALVPRTLTDLGLSANPVIAQPGERAAGVSAFLAWTSLIDPGQQRWIDLLLEMDAKSAAIVYQRALRRPSTSPKEISSFLNEILTVIAAAIKAALQKRGSELLTPLLSHARQRDLWDPALRIPAEREPYRFDLDGVMLDLSTICYPCAPQHRTPELLQPHDILADPYPLEDVKDGPLFARGTVLDRHAIQQIAESGRALPLAPLLAIFTLSPTAQYFQRIAGTRPS